MSKFLFAIILISAAGMSALGQTRSSSPAKAPAGDLVQMRSSPAFAELQLKKTELVSDLESLILDNTEEFTKVKEIRFVLTRIDPDISRL
jgi:hypothetical protein